MVTTVALISLGCAKNQVDAESMLGQLAQKGYQLTDDPAQAQVIIVNTCGFITSAKEESIETILDMARYKEEGVCRALIVTGCLAQRYAAQMLLGSAEMVLRTGRHPGQLKDEVCSPGGSTIAGVYALEKGGMRAAVMSAVLESFEKNKELGKQ